MYTSPVFYFASFLYKRVFPVYKFLYFIFKHIKERNEKVLYKKFIRKGSVVLDIGSNIGFHSILFSKLVGKSGRVLSFEPERSNFKHLKNNIKSTKNITIYPYAVGAISNRISFYISEVINVQHQTYPTNENKKGYTVKQVSIDDFLPKMKIDFMKIDIQGSEYHALLGMRKTIKQNPKIGIIMEMEPRLLDERDITPTKIYKFAKSMAMKVYVVKGSEVTEVQADNFEKYNSYKLYESDMWLLTKVSML